MLPFFCPTLSAFVPACFSTFPTHLVNSWHLGNENCWNMSVPGEFPQCGEASAYLFSSRNCAENLRSYQKRLGYQGLNEMLTPAWYARAQWALVPLCFQSDVRVTSCEVTQGVFRFICASHQLDNSDGGASSPSPWLEEAPGKWKCHLRPNPLKTVQDPALKCHPCGMNSMNTVTVRCSTYFGSSAEELQSWQRLCLKGHVGPKFGCRINTD
jgi:hypothetical protein